MTRGRDSLSKVKARVPSGLPGLDIITRGGFFRGGIYLFLAVPGSGKTILANQICFEHVAAGGRALYVTLLSESHARLLSSLEDMTFFDESRTGEGLLYFTAYPALEKDRFKGLLALLRKTVRDHKATLLVIDGFVSSGAGEDGELETKKFIHALQSFVELVGCTTLMLTGSRREADEYALRTMVDGLLELRQDALGMEKARSLEVSKFRGGPVLMGQHLFTISNAGVTIFPRIESYLGRNVEPSTASPRAPAGFGIEGLDAMLETGLRPRSVSLLLGAPGSGKTLLGLSHLAAGAEEGEQGLYFGFFEQPAELVRKSEAIGLRMGRHVAKKKVDLVWRSSLDGIADDLAETLLKAVKASGARRVFIDGLGGFRDSLVSDERARRFFGALCNELRSLDVVTVLSDETRRVSELEIPQHGLTAMLDNILFLRHVELRAQRHTLVSVMKNREGHADTSLREFSISSRGFVVSRASESADEILGGVSRPAPPPAGVAATRSKKGAPPRPRGR